MRFAEARLISIVDDEESIRASTKTLLRSVNYKVHTFASARELLNSETLAATDCLILDVHMPDIDGFELQRRLNEDSFRIPIIFITADDDSSLRLQVLEAGAVELLHKPFHDSVLLAAVQIALAGKHLEDTPL